MTSAVQTDQSARVAFGRIVITYSGESTPSVEVDGHPLSIESSPPIAETGSFAMEASKTLLLVSDRERAQALLVPRAPATTPLFVVAKDPTRPGRFRIRSLCRTPTTERAGVLYIAQAFGHTTGWVPAVFDAFSTYSRAPFVAAIRNPSEAKHVLHKVRDSTRMRLVPLYYDDTTSASITPFDVKNPSRPYLYNREAALLFVAANEELASEAAKARVVLNDCRPETFILHQIAESDRARDVPLHATRYAFAEFERIRRIAKLALAPSATRVPAFLGTVKPAIQTRRELLATFRASGLDRRRRPSVDFEHASECMLEQVPASGTIWYQAVHWRDLLSLERRARPYVVIPPLGQTYEMSLDQAVAEANCFVGARAGRLATLFAKDDGRPVVVVSQGTGFSRSSRTHWRAMLDLARNVQEAEFLLAGGSEADQGWLLQMTRERAIPNVTLLGWVDREWRALVRALRVKKSSVLVCRPGLSSIGTALANGIAPLMMTPDPIGMKTDAATAEVAMERAVYPFQFERLYTADEAHARDPLPIVLDTLKDDVSTEIACIRRALEPTVQARIRRVIDRACRWHRAANIIARVLARESEGDPMSISEKRALRDEELGVHP